MRANARYLKAEKSRLYVSGLVLRDPMLAEVGAPGPVVFTGSRRACSRWCKLAGFFFEVPK